MLVFIKMVKLKFKCCQFLNKITNVINNKYLGGVCHLSVSFKFVIFTNIMMESFRKPNIVYRIEP